MDSEQEKYLQKGWAEEPKLTRLIPYANYITPAGVVLEHLPADPYHLARYQARGFQITTRKPSAADAFTCDVCGKSVSSALALAGHKRTHKSNPTKEE